MIQKPNALLSCPNQSSLSLSVKGRGLRCNYVVRRKLAFRPDPGAIEVEENWERNQ